MKPVPKSRYSSALEIVLGVAVFAFGAYAWFTHEEFLEYTLADATRNAYLANYKASSHEKVQLLSSENSKLKAELEPPRWGFGLRAPLDLMTHLHVDGTDEPAYCDDPSQLMEQIKGAIEADRTDAGRLWCTPAAFSSKLELPMLRLSCLLRTSESGCEDYYMGELWTEHFERSTKNFVLRGYGWVRRTCSNGGGTYRVEDVSSEIADPSAALTDLLRPCRKGP